jgi:hypothetical protein
MIDPLPPKCPYDLLQRNVTFLFEVPVLFLFTLYRRFRDYENNKGCTPHYSVHRLTFFLLKRTVIT